MSCVQAFFNLIDTDLKDYGIGPGAVRKVVLMAISQGASYLCSYCMADDRKQVSMWQYDTRKTHLPLACGVTRAAPLPGR
jgi:hypothetical protein